MDGKDYIETEIDKAQFYARLTEKEKLPTTSAPSVGGFLQGYAELSQMTESILIHLSELGFYHGIWYSNPG
jgi:fatty acid-binding protein DegV